MSISEQIETMISSLTDNNIPAQLVTITKAYSNKICDINTRNGSLKNVRCSGIANDGDDALLVYEDGLQDKPFVLLFPDLTDYYTRDEIDEIITGGGVDLKNYVKKSEVKLGFSLEDNGTIILGIDVGDGF